ncbi:PaaI family thioesterase [Ideonella sp. DXS29W]|uniref:Medium/long-chain acyl-CoA thioesterase YigI n=1 Tax=Ideonella lacteola TaxID=2984193 RepID=A0ABU9BWD6_9BURK
MTSDTFDPDVFLQLGRDVLQRQPFSVLLGAELTHLMPGDVELQLPLRDDLKQQDGFAHGGVVSYLADNALTFAGGTAMRVPVVTSEFKINYLKPAMGERLVVRAKAVGVGRSQTVCRCDVFSVLGHEETLCAVAQGTISKRGDAPPA